MFSACIFFSAFSFCCTPIVPYVCGLLNLSIWSFLHSGPHQCFVPPVCSSSILFLFHLVNVFLFASPTTFLFIILLGHVFAFLVFPLIHFVSFLLPLFPFQGDRGEPRYLQFLKITSVSTPRHATPCEDYFGLHATHTRLERASERV